MTGCTFTDDGRMVDTDVREACCNMAVVTAVRCGDVIGRLCSSRASVMAAFACLIDGRVIYTRAAESAGIVTLRTVVPGWRVPCELTLRPS